MKHTHNWRNRILSILLVCGLISQICFPVYGSEQGIVAENEATDTREADAQNADTEENARAVEGLQLVLNENETLSLDLTTDTEYTGIGLGEGSTLSADTKGNQFTVTGDITGKGKLILKGNNITVQNISVSDLVFDTATVDAAGERTLIFGGTGNNLSDITLVGTEPDANATVWVFGVSRISNAKNTSFCYDNQITYNYQNQEIAAAADGQSLIGLRTAEAPQTPQ